MDVGPTTHQGVLEAPSVPWFLFACHEVQMPRNFLKIFFCTEDTQGATSGTRGARGPRRALVGSGAHMPSLHRLSAL